MSNRPSGTTVNVEGRVYTLRRASELKVGDRFVPLQSSAINSEEDLRHFACLSALGLAPVFTHFDAR